MHGQQIIKIWNTVLKQATVASLQRPLHNSGSYLVIRLNMNLHSRKIHVGTLLGRHWISSPSSSLLDCHYYSTNAPLPIQIPPMTNNLIKGQCH